MERSRDGRTPIVFVTDTAVEAVVVSDRLRSAGYFVVDVPLSMLVARGQVQPPHVVMLDVDAPGALEEVARLRRLPGSGAIDFIYFGSGEGTVRNADDAFANDGSAFFLRPLDVSGLVRRVEALTGGPFAARDIHSSPPPPSPTISRLKPSSQPPSRPSLPSPSARSPGPPLPLSTPALADLVDPPRAFATFGAVSSELQQLLVEAELRAQVQAAPELPLPSPEEEIEAVLPAEVLASLDEPLEYEDEELPSELRTGPGAVQEQGTGAHAKGTTSGETRQPTTGSARTAAPLTSERRVASEVPPADSTERRTLEVPADGPSVSVRIEPAVMVQSTPPAAPGKEDGIVLGPGDARRFFASAVAGRRSGALCFEHGRVVRRIVLRDGDLVTAASGEDRESLVHFLGARGELPRDDVDRLAAKVPPYGRHAGAALVAHGWLRQDQLWSVLRAHCEWIAASTLSLVSGIAQLEAEPPGRLRAEPSVFGAATGAEVFVELVRRAVSPDDAIVELGGVRSRFVDGANQALLSECALPPQEMDLLARARGSVIGDLVARGGVEIASVLHALVLLGVIDVVRAPDFQRGREKSTPAPEADLHALDEEAVRARVRARIELVDEGDYFAVLGVARDATGYEVRRAFIELRRNFEPSRILTPRLVDLEGDVRKIVVVIEEAYEILRDSARRERYRRAIEARPD